MRFHLRLSFTAILIVFTFFGSAQAIKPGFDKEEFIELLKVSSLQVDTIDVNKPNYIGEPTKYERIYRSDVMGLENRWDLWKRKSGDALVISIRGTTATAASWLENFYCAMIPAKGSLQLNDSINFKYHFANDPKAAVHVGWTIGMAYLAPDVMTKLSKLAEQGELKNLYIIGHSQGGALAFLLTSYIRHKMVEGLLPKDLTIKTYSSASPKVGNLYYAYDYDFITRGGWAFNIVNTADWVPEMPFSIQTTNDFTDLNPFPGLPKALKRVKPFYLRWYLKNVYRKLNNSTGKAQKDYTYFLGDVLFKMVHKNLPEFPKPEYVESMNYVRAGTAIILLPDSEYYNLYPNDDEKQIFRHHGMKPYLHLLEKQY